jgi:hypothetical protein
LGGLPHAGVNSLGLDPTYRRQPGCWAGGKPSYNISIGLGTSLPISGLSVPNEDATKLGSLQVVGTQYRLTLPISFNAIPDFSSLGAASGLLSFLLPLHLGFSGQLVGSAPKIAVPEPGSIVLLAIGTVSLALVGINRRRGMRSR